ncbi:hypothetical protein BDFB_013454 [Asbolus verrucosus]|uniref:Uncharacterized protein n=1 Tax=Asbolus verrucosus TaxID=1661398 RepID=A0A482W0T7_ASBVE|nr:hypothetical protein BDFB_013454 [Asbolus verrucosus]
MWNQTVSRGLY